MKMKKLLSMALALVMVLSLSVTALAAPGGSTGGSTGGNTGGNTGTTEPEAGVITELGKQEVTVSGTTQGATIKIKMSNTAAVVVNPYGLQVNVGTEESPDMKNAQVISATQWIENLSDVPLDAKIDITGTAGGSLKFAAASDLTDDALVLTGDNADTENHLLLYFEASTATNTTTEPTWKADYKTAKAATQDADYNAKLVAASADSGTTPGASINKMTLDATDGDTGAATDVLAYHFAGAAVKNPDTAWAATDTVSVALAFTFTVGTIA